MSNTTDDLLRIYKEQEEEFLKSLKSVNVLLLGQTGVGKSTLINTIFGEELAKVSDVKPETRGFWKYKVKDKPVTIIDSEGYELDKSDEFISVLDAEVQKRFNDINSQIHIAWYCISISSGRVLPYDISNIGFLAKKRIPTAVVLTQCDNDTPNGDTAKAMSAVITKNFGSSIKTFQVCNDKAINDEIGDLDSLMKWSEENINDDNLKCSFAIAQRANLELKYDKVASRVKWYAAAAATIGAVPIPIADAIPLTALQVKMTCDIFKIYGIDSSLSDVIKSAIGSKVVSMIAKSLVKFIPIVGSIVNATVAGTITWTMGYSINKIAKKMVTAAWDVPEEITDMLSSENIDRYIDEYQNSGKKETI